MINRHLSDHGINPIYFYIIAPFIFFYLSDYLFSNVALAKYIYLIIALSTALKLNETQKVNFLNYCFNNKQSLKIRILQNSIAVLPFVLFLIYKSAFLIATILFITAILFGVIKVKIRLNFVIPTPFGKNPFEFTIGFRKTYFLYFIAYFLTYKAVDVSNFNLGVFAMLLVFFVNFFYYLEPENKYYVWSFNLDVKNFLLKKIRTAIIYTVFAVLPIILILLVFFREDTLYIFAFLLLGFIFLTAVILAKYSVYPDKMQLPQIVIISLAVYFPPMFLVIIPYFYTQSLKQLKPILE